MSSMRTSIFCIIFIKIVLIASFINYLSPTRTSINISHYLTGEDQSTSTPNKKSSTHLTNSIVNADKGINENIQKYSAHYKPVCPPEEQLFGMLKVDVDLATNAYLDMFNITNIKSGIFGNSYLGRFEERNVNGVFSKVAPVFEPEHCTPPQTVAFIIPFRYREKHLRILLGHLIPILRRQFLRYSIFVISQVGNGTFNKGRLMNTGFEFAWKVGKQQNRSFDCFIFHDVDLLAEYDTLLYRCPGGSAVTHLATTIDKFNYRSMCCGITVGGVLGMTDKQYRKVNGYSNEYWGWGGEDDDMLGRIKNQKFWVSRPSPEKGRYTMLPHEKDKGNPENKVRHPLLKKAFERWDTDGLKNLNTNITAVHIYVHFTKVMTEVGEIT